MATTNIYKTFALAVGIVFLLVGILGFILNPTGGSLLGIFAVDVVHNIVHLLVGVLGIAAAYTGWPRYYARGLGIVYVLVGILGFIPGLDPMGMLMGIMHINIADNLLHLIVGAAALYVGFFLPERTATTANV